MPPCTTTPREPAIIATAVQRENDTVGADSPARILGTRFVAAIASNAARVPAGA